MYIIIFFYIAQMLGGGRVRAPENAKCSYRYINHRLISYLDPIRARFDQTGSDRRFS